MKNASLVCCVLACVVPLAQAQISSATHPSVSWFDLPLPQSARECGDEIKAADKSHPEKRSYREEIETQSSSDLEVFFDKQPSKTFSAFQSADLSGNILTLRISSKEKLDQYQGPVVSTVRKEIYGISLNAIATHVITAGLLTPLLLGKRARETLNKFPIALSK